MHEIYLLNVSKFVFHTDWNWYICFSFSGKYFDEISQDTGKYCFGVEDTLKALEMGAVEILIVWENLEIMRYVLKNHQTDGKCVCVCVCVCVLYIFTCKTYTFVYEFCLA